MNRAIDSDRTRGVPASPGRTSVSGEFKTYETFICYRGPSVGHSVGLEIAQVVYDAINGDPVFGGVFFAGMPNVHYDFMRDAPRIFHGIRKFVVVLCTNFFSGFFLDSSDSTSVQPSPESSTCLELKLAFENNCDLYPVFSGEFSWAGVDEKTMCRLEAYYGKENIDKLKHRANVYVWRQSSNDARGIAAYLSEMGVDGVLRFLRDLGDERTRDYEMKLTEFTKQNDTQSMRNWLRDIVDGYVNEKESVHYAAFYALQMMLRYTKDFEKSECLFMEYGERFSQHATYNHLWLLYVMESESDFDGDRALQLARNDSLNQPDNAGHVHLFPNLYAMVCEKAAPSEVPKIKERWGRDAQDAVDRAIALDETYAKYHCTKARILAIDGDFDGAERQINRAIAMEDSQRKDYMIRLADYQYHKIMIQLGKRMGMQGSGSR